MSHTKELISLFNENGNVLTLGQILNNWHRIGSKYTGRISDARKMGFNIVCEINREKPMENVYKLFEPQSGQYKMFSRID